MGLWHIQRSKSKPLTARRKKHPDHTNRRWQSLPARTAAARRAERCTVSTSQISPGGFTAEAADHFAYIQAAFFKELALLLIGHSEDPGLSPVRRVGMLRQVREPLEHADDRLL